MGWNIDWAWFDTSGGRVRWLCVIDTGTRMAAELLVSRFTEAAHLAATRGQDGRLNAPTVSWPVAQAGLEPGRRGPDGLVLPLDSTWTWDRRLLEFVPESFRKPARNQRNLPASDSRL